MFFYSLIVFIGLILTLIGIYEKRYDSPCYFAFSVILIILAGCRYGISTDYFAYLDIFQNSTKAISNEGRLEYGYLFLNQAFSFFGLSLGLLFAFTTSIIFLNLYMALKNFNVNKTCGLFVYFCIFYFINVFNIVRHGIAASFILYAFSLVSKNNFFKAVLVLLFSSLFHYISLVFLPIIFISRIRFNRKFIFISMIICLFFFRFMNDILVSLVTKLLPGNFNYFINSYINVKNESNIGNGTFIYFLLFFVFSLYQKKMKLVNTNMGYNITYNMMYLSFIFLIVLWQIPTALERLLNITRHGIIILIPYFFNIYKKDNKILIFILIIAICLLFYFNSMFLSDIPGKYAHFPYRWK